MQVNIKPRKNQHFKRQMPLHLMLLPGIIITFIFHYLPLAGLSIAFQKFNAAKGFLGNQKWVGLDNFAYIFALPNIWNVLQNTVTIAVAKIILGLVVPVVVALMLNELQSRKLQRALQTIVYFPHFLSWIILATILADLLSPTTGLVNQMLNALGMDSIFFMGDNRYFQGTLIWTEVWKEFGYGTVVYMATITGIDPTLYEAAAIDGANRWQQTWHITLTGLRMIIILMMVLSLGNVLNAGFDQVFNMYSEVVYSSGDILDTLMYRVGLESAKFGPATAVGLLKSVISAVLVSVAYLIAEKGFSYQLF